MAYATLWERFNCPSTSNPSRSHRVVTPETLLPPLRGGVGIPALALRVWEGTYPPPCPQQLKNPIGQLLAFSSSLVVGWAAKCLCLVGNDHLLLG